MSYSFWSHLWCKQESSCLGDRWHKMLCMLLVWTHPLHNSPVCVCVSACLCLCFLVCETVYIQDGFYLASTPLCPTDQHQLVLVTNLWKLCNTNCKTQQNTENFKYETESDGGLTEQFVLVSWFILIYYLNKSVILWQTTNDVNIIVTNMIHFGSSTVVADSWGLWQGDRKFNCWNFMSAKTLQPYFTN